MIMVSLLQAVQISLFFYGLHVSAHIAYYITFFKMQAVSCNMGTISPNKHNCKNYPTINHNFFLIIVKDTYSTIVTYRHILKLFFPSQTKYIIFFFQYFKLSS